ncbi:MAG TPA: hypothetical protein VN660_04835 [Steroidobacteraceae bacterium]|nr:hypothetical protein [Steroidobacteraceae bacterium]
MKSLVFEGPVQCLAQPRTGDWRLRGRLRGAEAGKPSAPVELLASGMCASASAQPLPSRLHELRVRVTAPLHSDRDGSAVRPRGAGAYGLSLEAREGRFTLQVESLRVHHDVSQSFYRALPRTSLSLMTRAGWATLLTLLRLRLISRLLTRTAQ